MPSQNNKLIFKNTLMLYIRMLLLMGVSLYTTRVILAVLGVDDYGIYQLIAGFISLFSILSSSLVYAVQRFFNIALGQDDEKHFGEIYSTSINLMVLMSVVILIIAETVGLWFVESQLNIPPGRENASFWVYQLSILTMIAHLLRTADNAAIISHEKMSFYAVISVLEALLKLSIVFLLTLMNFDKLILYTILYLASTIIVNVAYKVYCNIKFKSCHYHFIWNRALVKDMLSFSWWTLIGKGVQLGTLQGENFFLNRYYSVAVNAARGVAAEVYNAINKFLTNFQTAFKPQLVQTYVSEDKIDHLRLLYRSAKMSFYLLLVIIVPVLFNLDALLSLWLKEVPQYTKEFCVYVLFAYLVDALSSPLATSISANGNIKRNQIVNSLIFLLQLLSSFIALKSHAVPYIVSIFILCSHSLMFLSYLFFAHKQCSVSYKDFVTLVILPCLLVLGVSILLPWGLSFMAKGIALVFVHMILSVCWSLLIIWFVGTSKEEKNILIALAKSKLPFFGNRH